MYSGGFTNRRIGASWGPPKPLGPQQGFKHLLFYWRKEIKVYEKYLESSLKTKTHLISYYNGIQTSNKMRKQIHNM
jgi:hypothetical protein